MPGVALPRPFEAYKGNEPYIFVSYAHKDASLVYPELVTLKNLGYNVWYDEGIDPGGMWPEEIANAINHCAIFIVFMTPNAVNSRNVRDTINFAINKKKEFLAVHVVETELADSLQLRMGSSQCILKFSLSQDAYHLKLSQTLNLFLEIEVKKGNSEPKPFSQTNTPNPIENITKMIGRIFTDKTQKETILNNAQTAVEIHPHPDRSQKGLVFISANHADYGFAEKVYDLLASQNIPTFFSKISLPELGNADYRREIDKNLDLCQHMVVVASSVEHILDSDWVEAEWGFFINEKRSKRKTGNIITLAAGNLQPGSLPPSLRYYEVLPFDENGLKRLLKYVGA